MELYLVRHTSVKVPADCFYGRTDVEVADTFAAEAADVRKRLEGVSFDRVFTSPLSRAVKLATFCGYPEAVRDDRLLETNYGEWELKPFSNEDNPLLQEWYKDWVNVRPPGGESYMDQYYRVAGFLDEIKHSGLKTVAAFSHGGVLMCAAVYAGLYTIGTLRNFKCGYGTILKLEL